MSREPFAERSELVAYHLDHANELQPTPERRNAACTALAEAAASAVRRGAVARGQALYEQAADLSEGSEQVDWLIAAGEVALRRWRGDYAIRLYREIGETAERIGDPRAADGYARAVEIGTRMSGISGNPDADQLRPMLERGAIPGHRRRHRHQGQAPARRGLDRLEERSDPRDGAARPGGIGAGPRGRRPHRPAVRARRGHGQRLAAGPAPRRGRAHEGTAGAATRRSANRRPSTSSAATRST